MNCGLLIQEVRRHAGLSQGELAERAGTSQSAVSAYEQNRRTPTLSTMERLVSAAGARLDLGVVLPHDRPSTTLRRNRHRVLECARRHGVRRVLVFGSVARDEDTEDSDIDLLMDFPAGTSLLGVLGVQQELTDLLGVSVDLGTPESLRPAIRDQVLAEAHPL